MVAIVKLDETGQIVGWMIKTTLADLRQECREHLESGVSRLADLIGPKNIPHIYGADSPVPGKYELEKGTWLLIAGAGLRLGQFIKTV